METNSFWLIYIQDTQLVASLVEFKDNKYRLAATGPYIKWDLDSESSFISAVDESLSAASLNANLSEDKEPSNAAFVVPPFWVDNDGKISSPKLKMIKSLCKELNLKPSGFLSEDEAVIEEGNQKDDLPASFILIHLNSSEFYLSLVYLGNIKERIRKKIEGPFTAKLIESTLLELNSESALPPQIILFGDQASQYFDEIKNFPWVDKKDIETFLHLPEVKIYNDSEILNIFSKVITSQIQPTLTKVKDSSSKEKVQKPEEVQKVEEAFLQETDPSELGFSSEVPIEDHLKKEDVFKLPIINDYPIEATQNLEAEIPLANQQTDISEIKKAKFSLSFLKKIKIPKIKFKKANFQNFFWITLIALPLLLFLNFFVSKAQITLFIIPYTFKAEIPVTLIVDGQIEDIVKSIIPVQKETFKVEADATIKTTGELTTGERAKGEIIIYNKSNQPQKLTANTVLIDPLGKKFELTTQVLIASSSSNLDEGVINLGKTKTAIIALDIGSEFNIKEDIQLQFEEISDSILIARVSKSLSGGSKEQIAAVSSQDKIDIETKLDEKITNNINDKTKDNIQSLFGILKETIQITKNKIELSREIGESADELNADVQASVSVFTLNSSVKELIIKQFLSDQENFNDITIDTNDFDFIFTSKKVESQKATGILTVKGSAIPNINFDQLKKSLSFKTKNKAQETIKKIVKRAYNSHIDINSPIDILPFRLNNISIEIKSENL